MDFFYKSLAAILKGPIKYRSRKAFPNVNETISCDKLSHDVTVTRDANGVTHISCQSLEDVVFTQGYVHAQDRLWQMELHRPLARGQLSEMFGKIALNTDRTARTFGFERLGLQDYENISDLSKKIFQSYIDGINFFLTSSSKVLHVEFFLTGCKPRLWELADGTSVITTITSAFYSNTTLDTPPAAPNNTFTSQILLRTTSDINKTGYDYFTGYGLLNISLALEAVQDNIAPKVKMNNDELIITDNVGLYRIESLTEIYLLQGQNRTVILQHIIPNQEIEIQD